MLVVERDDSPGMRVRRRNIYVGGREQEPSTSFLGDREPEEPRPHRRVLPPDFVWHEPDQDIRGYEQAKQFVSSFFEAFPDISITIDDVIAEGDQAVSRYTIRGTHQGETEEFGPPTGRQFELQGITIHRFENAKIVEEWERYDNLSVLQQLGLAPEQ
jgi:steroid delta-isomerase-like uncharacterized protein